MTPQEAQTNIQALIDGAITNGMFKNAKAVIEMQQSLEILFALIPLEAPQNS